jgi:hypothetical protein
MLDIITNPAHNPFESWIAYLADNYTECIGQTYTGRYHCGHLVAEKLYLIASDSPLEKRNPDIE